MKKYKCVPVIWEFLNAPDETIPDAYDLVNVDDESDRLMAAPDEFFVGEIYDESQIEMRGNAYIDENGNYGHAQFAFLRTKSLNKLI